MNIAKLMSLFAVVMLISMVSLVSAEDRNIGVVIYPPAGGTESVCLTFDSGDSIYDALDEATGAIEDNYERADDDSDFELSIGFSGDASEVSSVTRNSITTSNDLSNNQAQKIWSVFTNQGNSSTYALLNDSLATTTFSQNPSPNNGYVIALQYATFNQSNLSSSVPAAVAHSNICENMLDIDEIEVEVDGSSSGADEDGGDIDEDVMPESTITFDITLENLYNDDTEMLIEDITIEAVFEDIDDGDDLEVTVDITEIEAEDDETVTISFDIPLIVEIDEYDLVLTIEAEDENGLRFEYEIEYVVEIEKEKHEVRITEFEVEPSQVSCERLISMNYQLLNLGEEEEDVDVSITNQQLEIDRSSSKTLSEDVDDSSNQLSDSLSIMIPDNISAGTYRILLEAEYYNDIVTNRYVDFIVSECIREEPEPTTPEEDGTTNDEQAEDEVEVIRLNETTTPEETQQELQDEEGLPLWAIILLIAGGLVLYIGTILVVLVVASGKRGPRPPKRPPTQPRQRRPPVQPQEPVRQPEPSAEFDDSESFY